MPAERENGALYHMPARNHDCPKMDASHRPTVCYKRLSKTGGTLVSNIFDRLNQRNGIRFPQQEYTWIKDGMRIRPPKHSFVIGSIRNVCELYQSLWNYNPTIACPGASSDELRVERCKATAESHKDFASWLVKSAGGPFQREEPKVGFYTREFWCTYISPESTECTSNVAFNHTRVLSDMRSFTMEELDDSYPHCWARAESLLDDVKHCLQRYRTCKETARIARGKLDAETVEHIIDSVAEQFANSSRKMAGRDLDKKRLKPDQVRRCRSMFREPLRHDVAAGALTFLEHPMNVSSTPLDILRTLDTALLNITGCCRNGE